MEKPQNSFAAGGYAPRPPKPPSAGGEAPRPPVVAPFSLSNPGCATDCRITKNNQNDYLLQNTDSEKKRSRNVKKKIENIFVLHAEYQPEII